MCVYVCVCLCAVALPALVRSMPRISQKATSPDKRRVATPREHRRAQSAVRDAMRSKASQSPSKKVGGVNRVERTPKGGAEEKTRGESREKKQRPSEPPAKREVVVDQDSRDKKRVVDRSRDKTREVETAKRRKGDKEDDLRHIPSRVTTKRPKSIARPASAALRMGTSRPRTSLRTAAVPAGGQRTSKGAVVIERVQDDGRTAKTPHTKRSPTGDKAVKAKINLHGSDASRLGFSGVESNVPRTHQRDESHLPDHACGARERRVRYSYPFAYTCAPSVLEMHVTHMRPVFLNFAEKGNAERRGGAAETRGVQKRYDLTLLMLMLLMVTLLIISPPVPTH
jgi:hypothetical protein